MNKGELINEIAAQANITKAAAARALEAFIGVVTKRLSKGKADDRKVVITGFGSFLVSKRGAKNGHNPATGKAMKIPAMTLPRFKPGKGLKEAVKKS